MVIIQLLASFLSQQESDNLPRVYAIADGLLNIVQSGQKDKQSQASILYKFANAQQVQ